MNREASGMKCYVTIEGDIERTPGKGFSRFLTLGNKFASLTTFQGLSFAVFPRCHTLWYDFFTFLIKNHIPLRFIYLFFSYSISQTYHFPSRRSLGNLIKLHLFKFSSSRILTIMMSVVEILIFSKYPKIPIH